MSFVHFVNQINQIIIKALLINLDLCPAGKALYKESSTKNPVRCIIKNNRNQCPSGFSCQSNLPGAFQVIIHSIANRKNF